MNSNKWGHPLPPGGRVRLTQRGAVRLALVLHDLLEKDRTDFATATERCEEVVRLVAAVLEMDDGLTEPCDDGGR